MENIYSILVIDSKNLNFASMKFIKFVGTTDSNLKLKKVKPFLQNVSDEIIQHSNLKNTTVVVPGNRARLYLKKHLTSSLRNSWLPHITTMGEWLQQHGGIGVLSQEESLIALYKIYLELPMTVHDDFDSYSLWAPTALADFNTIDTYMLDGEKVFRDLRNIKEIENWSFLENPLSREQENFLHFWNMVGNLYKSWNDYCREIKKGQQGLSARMAAESLEIIKLEKGNISFVGLNILSKAEEVLVYGLIKSNKAEAIWDVDRYYIQDPIQEAGMFLRKHHKQLSGLNGMIDQLSHNPPVFKIWEASTKVAQAKIAGALLEDLDQAENTALILADESLSLPVLNSLPNGLKVNVTLGYPLNGSTVELLFKTAARMVEDIKSGGFYHVHFNALIQNPLLQSLLSDAAWGQLFKKAIQDNYIYIKPEYWTSIDDWFSNWLSDLFHAKTFHDISKNIEALLRHIIPQLKKSSIEQSQSILTLRLLEHIRTLFEKHTLSISLRTWSRFVKQHILKNKVSFLGEPIEGVQIMGVLESRTLDFERVIWVGMNEGVFPTGDKPKTFIPHDLRRELGLPGNKEQDAIFAYYFYRTLHRSSRVDIISTLQSSTLGSSEPSRFIHQVTNELKANITREPWNLPTPIQVAPELNIPNSEEIKTLIRQRLLKGISPSAFNTFIMCPLDFYHKYVLGLREPDEVVEGVENSVFGTAVHNILEELYSPFVGKVVNKEVLKSYLSKIPELVMKEFTKVFPKDNLLQGPNLLAVEASKHYLSRFLKWEMEQIGEMEKVGKMVKIIALEKRMTKEIKLSGANILLKGTADRIDQVGNTIRVIDYKTGKVESSDLSCNHAEEIYSPKKIKLLQILCYAYLCINNIEIPEDLEIGMISLRSINNGMVVAKRNKKSINKEEIPELLEEVLQQVVNDLLNEDLVWEHQKDAKFCDYCLSN